MVTPISPASPSSGIPWRPRQVWIDRQVVDSPVTANVLAHLPDVPTAVIDGPPPVPAPTNQAALMTSAKKTLYLTAQKGHFVRACPGASSRNSQSQLCCGYMIVDLIYNCNYDCTYCYLQSYVNAPYLTVYANVEQLFDELGTFLRTHPQPLVRIGSGEFSDSLSLDPLTGFSRLLVPFLRQFPNVLFEFKTKSDLVDDLLDLEPDGKVMVRAAGYKIGLHFDPLLYYPGWEADYEPFVAQVFDTVPPGDVTYMSMGSLRFPPALKDIVRARFPKSRLMYAELVPGADGKMRYFKPLRTEMYAKMFSWIRRYTADTGLYLCMESQEIWQKVFGHAPACSADVEQHIQGAELQSRSAATQVVPLSSLTFSPRAAL